MTKSRDQERIIINRPGRSTYLQEKSVLNSAAAPDCVEVWLSSLRGAFESAGVAVIFSRSTDDRPNPSCAVNLRLGTIEADLVIWESGEADLAMIGPDGATEQRHFDEIRDVNKLAAVMARMVHRVER